MIDWWLDHGDVRLAHGDAATCLAEMDEGSVQCIVTSPPFYGLRDYGTATWEGGDADCDHRSPAERRQIPHGDGRTKDAYADERHLIPGAGALYPDVCGKCGAQRVDRQIGLEPTPEEWVESLVRVFREARRVLRDDGVFWLEVGDTYNAYNGNRGTQSTYAGERVRVGEPQVPSGHGLMVPTLKPKDLVGAPWMLAFALRADGWYLRSDTIWWRPNPMPESVLDRPTKAHSYVFLLTKSPRYFYDAEAIREPHKHDGRKATQIASNGAGISTHENYEHRQGAERWPGSGANVRSVWSIPTESTPYAHFATFPQALVERCLKAGTSERGACCECGRPWVRIVRATGGLLGASWHDHADDLGAGAGQGTHGQVMYATYRRESVGWQPACDHYDHLYALLPRPSKRRKAMHRDSWPGRWKRVRARAGLEDWRTVPCVALDPFMGSGTTAVVARRLHLHAVGIDLSEEYLRIASDRLKQLSLFA